MYCVLVTGSHLPLVCDDIYLVRWLRKRREIPKETMAYKFGKHGCHVDSFVDSF